MSYRNTNKNAEKLSFFYKLIVIYSLVRFFKPVFNATRFHTNQNFYHEMFSCPPKSDDVTVNVKNFK